MGFEPGPFFNEMVHISIFERMQSLNDLKGKVHLHVKIHNLVI